MVQEVCVAHVCGDPVSGITRLPSSGRGWVVKQILVIAVLRTQGSEP